MGMEIVEVFNNFLLYFPSTIRKHDADKYFNNENAHSIILVTVTEYDVISALKGQNNSTNVGGDGMQMKPQKRVLDLLAPHLAQIYICLEIAVFQKVCRLRRRRRFTKKNG